MAKFIVFEDLPIWQEARNLAKLVYSYSSNNKQFANDYRFVSQIKAAIGSVMDNIAEGFERENNKEFIHFLYIAKGSCGEVRSQLHRAMDVGYLSADVYEHLLEQTFSLSKSLSNFIQYLKTSELSGTRNTKTKEERKFSNL